MDEYLFVALAKLKADRLQLEREQQLALPLEPRSERAAPVETHRHSARTRWFSQQPLWREQS